MALRETAMSESDREDGVSRRRFLECMTLGAPACETMQGFNVRHWTQGGLDFWAVRDINQDELTEFSQKFIAEFRPIPGLS
jgi:hypothetical protein